MRKASSKEEFDRKIAQDAERETKRRVSQSSMPPRSEWKQDAKPSTFQDAYAPTRPKPSSPQTKRPFEESLALSIMTNKSIAKNDPLREQAKREHFGIQTEEDKVVDLEQKIAELERKLQ